MQHLLSTCIWDADLVRDDLRDYVVEHLGDAGGVWLERRDVPHVLAIKSNEKLWAWTDQEPAAEPALDSIGVEG